MGLLRSIREFSALICQILRSRRGNPCLEHGATARGYLASLSWNANPPRPPAYVFRSSGARWMKVARVYGAPGTLRKEPAFVMGGGHQVVGWQGLLTSSGVNQEVLRCCFPRP